MHSMVLYFIKRRKMDEKNRPGGLIALAVINFIFAAFSILGVLGLLIGKIAVNYVPMEQIPESQAAQIAAFQNMSGTILAVIICKGLITFLLLLLSGIGYLKLKRILGRILGSIYGAVAILFSILSTMAFSEMFAKSFGIGSVISLIYPLLTLILLNTIFRKDLVH
jgi:hypothetical protein